MKAMEWSKYLGYSIALLSFCAGVVFISGVYLSPAVPQQLRIMCGVVFLLLSVYRYVATRNKIHEQQRAER